MVEQEAVNFEVVGSSLTGRAIFLFEDIFMTPAGKLEFFVLKII